MNTGVPFGTKLHLPNPRVYKDSRIDLVLGKEHDLDALSRHLTHIGYQRVEQVLSPGEFSRRGDILDGDTSGRDSLYDDFWEYFLYRATPLQQLLGGRANYTLTVSNNYAHNDWIEILVNQGILGIFVFFMYWKSFFRTAFRTNLDKTCSIVIKMIFIGYFAKTMFSMSYTDYNIW